MNNLVKNYTEQIEGGDTLRFEALGSEGRLHIEGTGDITLEVSVDGVTYISIEHDVTFVNGKAIAPIQLFIGDQVRLSATTLTKVILNYNKLRN